ncbi:MAG: trypsin-like serine protease [Myxococcota bacterium]|nr:trypsin-like serine protease [Myxococcota bacterium]
MSPALLTMLSSAVASPPPPPIVDGDTTDDFAQVGVLAMRFGEYRESFCSGTLIHRRWVLTAAHCLSDLDAYVRHYGAEIVFMVGSDMSNGDSITEEVLAVDWFDHPSYSAQSLTGDIGLVELDEALSMMPMPLNEEPPSADWSDEPLTYVGWGVTSDNGYDSGVKRYAEIPYYEHDEQFIYAYDSGGSNVCYGDSGGAGLVGSPEQGYAIAGVNSFVYPSCVGGYSGATRVDQYIDWIAESVPLEENVFTADDVVLEDLLSGGESSNTVLPGDGSSSDDKSSGGCTVAPVGGSMSLILLGALTVWRRRE